MMKITLVGQTTQLISNIIIQRPYIFWYDAGCLQYICERRLLLCLVRSGQRGQWNCGSFPHSNLRCLIRFPLFEYPFPHCGHKTALFAFWRERTRGNCIWTLSVSVLSGTFICASALLGATLSSDTVWCCEVAIVLLVPDKKICSKFNSSSWITHVSVTAVK